MRIGIFIDKNVHENAAYYYELAKEARKKAAGVEKAIKETEKAIEDVKKKKTEKKIRIKRKKEWYEAFHYFFTSGGKLVIGGKTAQQNDLVFKKYMEENDLFFHADIQGGSAVILKNGCIATEDEIRETAQFAASFSNAWKNGNASVDVYAVKKDQLSKHAQGGYIAAGAFAISGERRWFKATPLGLKVVVENDVPKILPAIYKNKFEKEIFIYPSKSGKEKGETARFLARILKTDEDELLSILPAGKTIARNEKNR
ncbi:MAG: NFACT RNA binding domain-containing protein [Candidatus Bilamarchaeaceae archaeon]